MKVKQVVGEHKKGFRAKKYASKPKNTIAPKKPEPIKPVGTVKPGDVVKEDPTANVAVKPVTGASEVDVNGQKIATTTDASAAATIAQLAKDGKIAVPAQGTNPNATTPTSMEEDLFGTTEQELAKDPSPAGEYYRKLAALKTDPRWAGRQDIVQKRIEDLVDRINNDQGVPQPAQGQPMGPETDPAKFQQKNPGFGQPGMLDRLKQLINHK